MNCVKSFDKIVGRLLKKYLKLHKYFAFKKENLKVGKYRFKNTKIFCDDLMKNVNSYSSIVKER